MKKLIPLFVIATLLSFELKAQCDANFTYSANQNQVTFSSAANASTAKHKWFFGDGGFDYWNANPTHIYLSSGTYNVLHVVQDSANNCVDSVFKAVTLSFGDSCNLNASFTYQADSINPQQVHFTGSPNQPGLIYSWNFGDGQYGSGRTPSHYYATTGSYAVSLAVYDSLGHCGDSLWVSINVNGPVDTCNLNASFSYQANPANPKQIHFTGSPNQPQLTYMWNFGDNQGGSGRTPTHTYSQPGNYNVILVVFDSATNCIDTVRRNVTVNAPDSCNLNASFTYRADSLQPRKIYFTGSPNQPQLRYTWNFGDNTTGSGRTPVHTYGQPGQYYVMLAVFDSVTNCRDSVWQYVNVTRPDTCTASFTYTVSGGQVVFTASSNETIVDQLWLITSLPDSSDFSVTLHSNNPTVNLPDSGFYYVCLAVTTNSGCVKWYCDSILYTGGNSARIAVIPSYPNPVNVESQIRFNLNLDGSAVIKYRVSSLAGNTVFQSQRQGVQGVNTISIPVQQLGRGQYFIDITYGNNQKRSVFQKL